MNWFDKWLSKKMRQTWEEARNPSIHINTKESYAINAISSGMAISKGSRDTLDANPDLYFKMYRAENGYVMEVRQHDKRTDRTNINLHLITDSEDLGTAISHVITVESLKVQ